jgi:hypothetical protein
MTIFPKRLSLDQNGAYELWQWKLLIDHSPVLMKWHFQNVILKQYLNTDKKEKLTENCHLSYQSLKS